MATLAHLSDLHLGRPGATQRAAGLVDELLAQRVDHVVVTGDITHAGLVDEYETFTQLFAPLARLRRLTVVPGNHDRGGDDVADLLSDGKRVSVHTRRGLHVVRVDSTAPHNKASFRSHGALCAQVLAQIDDALSTAPEASLVVVALHHHVLPLPVEGIGEWFAELFGWPHASELALGTDLLRQLRGRCDLVLHGHRHIPRSFVVDGETQRPLHVLNAGSSAELGACRVLTHHDGRLASAPRWLTCAAGSPSRHVAHTPALTVCLA